ncbi:MAG: transposase, partial [Halomonas sp.]|nr:transposase [Halomonas sp.]
MKTAAYPSPETIAELQRKLAAQQSALDKQQAENARLLALIARKEAQWEAAKQSLFEQFRLAIERRFGPSTEKYRVEQGDLLINEAEVAVDEADAETADETVTAASAAEPSHPAKRRGGRVALPPELPRVEVVHELPEETRHCAGDGSALAVIGQEVSEELHVVPARVEVIRHIRFKYACPACEEGVQIAPPPAKLLPKSNASATLLAYIATAKYQDALPLYRQSQIFARHGAEIPRNTLA